MTPSTSPSAPAVVADDSSESYRVAWRCRLTNRSGHGQPLTRALADIAADTGRQMWPSIDHWVEAV